MREAVQDGAGFRPGPSLMFSCGLNRVAMEDPAAPAPGMRPEDILKFLRQRPFRPFQITLTDGRVYDIHHPELVMVGRSDMEIGIPSPRYKEPVYERIVFVSLLHVMQVEMLPESGAG